MLDENPRVLGPEGLIQGARYASPLKLSVDVHLLDKGSVVRVKPHRKVTDWRFSSIEAGNRYSRWRSSLTSSATLPEPIP